MEGTLELIQSLEQLLRDVSRWVWNLPGKETPALLWAGCSSLLDWSLSCTQDRGEGGQGSRAQAWNGDIQREGGAVLSSEPGRSLSSRVPSTGGCAGPSTALPRQWDSLPFPNPDTSLHCPGDPLPFHLTLSCLELPIIALCSALPFPSVPHNTLCPSRTFVPFSPGTLAGCGLLPGLSSLLWQQPGPGCAQPGRREQGKVLEE